MERRLKRGSKKLAYALGIVGVILTILMAIAVVYFWEPVSQKLEGYGYFSAFAISILGGATIIIPVPMLAVVFALGGVLKPYWVGLAAGLGETFGALIIYTTGHGAGTALYKPENTGGRLQPSPGQHRTGANRQQDNRP